MVLPRARASLYRSADRFDPELPGALGTIGNVVFPTAGPAEISARRIASTFITHGRQPNWVARLDLPKSLPDAASARSQREGVSTRKTGIQIARNTWNHHQETTTADLKPGANLNPRRFEIPSDAEVEKN